MIWWYFQQEWIGNGKDILITQNNLDIYIDKKIEYLLKFQMDGAKQIINSINILLPFDYLKIFTSDQLGFINKIYTIYWYWILENGFNI